jgi:hypothetical protein
VVGACRCFTGLYESVQVTSLSWATYAAANANINIVLEGLETNVDYEVGSGQSPYNQHLPVYLQQVCNLSHVIQVSVISHNCMGGSEPSANIPLPAVEPGPPSISSVIRDYLDASKATVVVNPPAKEGMYGSEVLPGT